MGPVQASEEKVSARPKITALISHSEGTPLPSSPAQLMVVPEKQWLIKRQQVDTSISVLLQARDWLPKDQLPKRSFHNRGNRAERERKQCKQASAPRGQRYQQHPAQSSPQQRHCKLKQLSISRVKTGEEDANLKACFIRPIILRTPVQL